ncbi:hypothetical protein I79_003281 [Cricetulus griseus]|uniref:Uncharacterized protein n=1 Tax=Cricetulus griseus TaxID=10029 RepID=G3GZK6_CRIGR|nr:hypothetical protein I79_003281 [Cricetulus griseus]
MVSALDPHSPGARLTCSVLASVSHSGILLLCANLNPLPASICDLGLSFLINSFKGIINPVLYAK